MTDDKAHPVDEKAPDDAAPVTAGRGASGGVTRWAKKHVGAVAALGVATGILVGAGGQRAVERVEGDDALLRRTLKKTSVSIYTFDPVIVNNKTFMLNEGVELDADAIAIRLGKRIAHPFDPIFHVKEEVSPGGGLPNFVRMHAITWDNCHTTLPALLELARTRRPSDLDTIAEMAERARGEIGLGRY